MYDRLTRSLWQQITGTAFAGPKRGTSLEALPVSMTEWGQWKTEHPGAEVLAPPDPDYQYVLKRYGDYEQSDRLLFPVKLQDARLHPKKIIYGIRVGKQAIAVDAAWLAEQGRWTHDLDSGELQLDQAADGSVIATLDGAVIAAHRMFWFAWYSFNPHTALVDSLP
jgi:hypothetical protein